MNPRRLLLELFEVALQAASGRLRVAQALRRFTPEHVSVFAIGKAASSMALGACDALGDRVASLYLVTKDGHIDPELHRVAPATLRESAHPMPDQRSLDAGAELIERVRAISSDTFPLFLVSGGASSLVDALTPGHSLQDLRALNQEGLSSGWDIARFNSERARISALKSGGIASLLAGREACALFISDVPGDSPDLIGSGLLGHWRGKPDRIERLVVASIADTVDSVAAAARARALEVELRGRFDAPATQTAREFVGALRASPAELLVWGGESTVTLPERSGRGGRNSHLALSAACLLEPDEPLWILAAGTDGSDGPTEDAGGLVDAGTVQRAELGGIDVETALRDFDSGTALEAAEDLVHTGPTGTNVGDILIGLKLRNGARRDLATPRML